MRQNCSQRADEVIHVYKKKICEKQILLPTIFGWLVIWARKKFGSFLKLKLQNCNVKIRENTRLHELRILKDKNASKVEL